MKKKKIWIIVLFIILLCITFYLTFVRGHDNISSISKINNMSAFDAKNSTFEIEGNIITLKNGVSETEIAPGSASKVITKYFGNESEGDLNKDGLKDVAFLVTQDSGGSGTFFYAVVALKTTDGYKTTNAFFIGDRIAPQPTEINSSSSELYINYAERKADEPMTTQPSVGVTKILKISSNGNLIDLIK